jgi:hemerythrin-like domain-containing protein
VVFTFADRELSDAAKAAIQTEYDNYEASALAQGVTERYKAILLSLEARI